MIRAVLTLLAALIALPLHAQADVLWYRQPAPVWDNALPIGNGRLGAMVFGGANTGANNGDSQDAKDVKPLLDGSKTSAADAPRAAARIA